MTDWIILSSMVPLIFAVFGGPARFKGMMIWLSVLIAAAANGYFFYLHAAEPGVWIPAGAFLSLFALTAISERQIKSLSALGVAFISQALLSRSTGHIIILLAFADMFFCVELFLSSKVEEKSRAVKSIYQSAWSFLPAAAAVLLDLQGDAFTACVAATVAMRLFSWPVNHWIYEIHENKREFMIYLGGASAFALWHVQDFAHGIPWGPVWLAAAFCFSLGVNYLEIYGAVALGLFCLSPALGVLAMAVWPLFAHQGKLTYLSTLVAGAGTALIAETSSKFLIDQASYPLAALAGIFLARVFAGTRLVPVKWYWEVLDFMIAGVWCGLAIWLTPPDVTVAVGPGVAFAGAFVLFFLLGLIFRRKKPRLFSPVPGLSPQVFSRDLLSLGFLSERSGGPVKVPNGRLRQAAFAALESEAHVAILLGILGAFLIWGMR